MPDANGTYLGDHATVLPDNTQALMHFSSQFQQREQQRRAQKAANEKAEEDRQIRLQKYIGDRLTAKDYEPLLQSELNGAMADLRQKIKEGAKETDVMAAADNYAGAMHLKNNKVKSVEKNIGSHIAELMKEHPTLDAGALAVLAKSAALKKRDPNGNWIDKTPDEIDENQNYVTSTYLANLPDLHPQEQSRKQIAEYVTKEPTVEVNEEPTYDANGNLITRGIVGKIAPGLVKLVADEKGKPVYGTDGKAQYELMSENYRLPGETSDFVDEQGKKVKVASDAIFQKYYNGNDAIKAEVERKVRADLENPANFNGSGESSFGPGSEYADMLRKKHLFDILQDNVKDRFILNAGKDESFARKNQIRAKQIQEAHLRISNDQNSRAERRFAWEKSKAKAKDNGNDIEPLTDKYEKKAAQSVPNPLGGPPLRYVKLKDIDKGDLNIITGNKATSMGTPYEGNVEPMVVGGEEVFLLSDDGDWYGGEAGDQRIDREGAFTRQLNNLEQQTLKTAIPPKPGIIKSAMDKAKKYFTPKPAKKKDDPLGILP